MPDLTTTIHPTGVYSPDDVCDLLGISPQVVADARRTGALRSVRRGRRALILGAWVLAWLRDEQEEVGDAR
jgi:hypothetical protein